MAVTIRDAAPADEAAWRALWASYIRFYQAEVPDEVTAATWRRILDPEAPLFARLAERGGAVAGFCVCVLHPGTWTTAPVCYLEDLFVSAEARGAGLGKALIEDLIGLARTRGWSRLYWHTRADNHTARRLYDRFATADDFVRYRLVMG